MVRMGSLYHSLCSQRLSSPSRRRQSKRLNPYRRGSKSQHRPLKRLLDINPQDPECILSRAEGILPYNNSCYLRSSNDKTNPPELALPRDLC